MSQNAPLDHERICVETNRTEYDVIISRCGFAGLGAELHRFDFGQKVLVATDETIKQKYWQELEPELQAAGYDPQAIVVPKGARNSKKLSTLTRLYDTMYDLQFDRKSLLIGFGGGGIGDIACFAAGTYMRGIPFAQVPTSLLGQVDSAIGGKGAVHYHGLANLIGVYHQPIVVWSNIALIAGLTTREYRSGLSEIVKAMFVGDQNGLDRLTGQTDSSVKSSIFEFIVRACKVKASLVSADERESGPRLLLNYGHTIGHAIEEGSRFRYTHGESIAMGMMGACFVGETLGITPPRITELHRATLRNLHLPTSPVPSRLANGISTDELVDQLVVLASRDKKVQKGAMRFVLLRDVADAEVIRDVSPAIVRMALTRLIANP